MYIVDIFGFSRWRELWMTAQSVVGVLAVLDYDLLLMWLGMDIPEVGDALCFQISRLLLT
jgi:hypothetical protein